MSGGNGGGDGKDAFAPATAPAGSGDEARRERTEHRHLMRFGGAETVVMPMWQAKGTSVREIEAQLGRIWQTRMGGAAGDDLVMEKGRSHARASVLNLIVTAPDAAAAERIAATMMSLGARHPSRAIVLVADPAEAGDQIDASITVHCHPGPTHAEQICHETVMLTVRGEAAAHLSGVVAPLLIHDLPTHVWWPGDPPFADPIFDQLVEICDRLIVDSADFTDLRTGCRRLSNLRRQSGVGDLAWERLAWWHEVTAEFFDTPRFRRYLPNLNRLIIRYAVPSPGARGPEHPEEVAPGCSSPITQAVLYAGWLASRLNWRRHQTTEPLSGGRLRLTLEGRYEMVDLLIEPVQTDDYEEGELVSVSLRALGEAGAAEFIVDRSPGDATLATNADGMTAALRTITCETKSEAELLSQQLIVDRHDPIFEAALRAAAIFLDAARSEAESVA